MSPRVEARAWIRDQLRRHQVASGGPSGPWTGAWLAPGDRFSFHGPRVFVQEMTIDADGTITGTGSDHDAAPARYFTIEGVATFDGDIARVRWIKTYTDNFEQVDHEGVLVGGEAAGHFVHRTASHRRGTFALSRSAESPPSWQVSIGAILSSALNFATPALGLFFLTRGVVLAALFLFLPHARAYASVHRSRRRVAALSGRVGLPRAIVTRR